jgi:hypothetical protein
LETRTAILITEKSRVIIEEVDENKQTLSWARANKEVHFNLVHNVNNVLIYQEVKGIDNE